MLWSCNCFRPTQLIRVRNTKFNVLNLCTEKKRTKRRCNLELKLSFWYKLFPGHGDNWRYRLQQVYETTNELYQKCKWVILYTVQEYDVSFRSSLRMFYHTITTFSPQSLFLFSITKRSPSDPSEVSPPLKTRLRLSHSLPSVKLLRTIGCVRNIVKVFHQYSKSLYRCIIKSTNDEKKRHISLCLLFIIR